MAFAPLVTALSGVQEAGSSDPNVLFDRFKKTILKELDVCVPAIVNAYDAALGEVVVTRLVKRVMSNGESVENLPFRVSVLQIQHGGFFQNAPLYVGDTGWVFAADLDTRFAKSENSSIQEPDTGIGSVDKTTNQPYGNQGEQRNASLLRHAFCRGFFIPDKWGGVPLPDDIRNSYVVGQVNANGSSRGRFVMDPDGRIRMISTRWYDAKEPDFLKRVKGGLIDIDLRYRYADAALKQDIIGAGDVRAIANLALDGRIDVRSWKDENGNYHGGYVYVEHDVTVGGNVEVTGNEVVKGGVDVCKPSVFHSKVEVVQDNKRAIIDPRNDLHKSDAKFREVTVLTGLKHDKNDKNKVSLKARKIRVLADEGDRADDVEFEVGGGGGGGGGGDMPTADLYSIDYIGGTDTLELAQFQKKGENSREDDETIVSDVDTAARQPSGRSSEDVDYKILVRKVVGGVMQLYYKALGLFVTGIKSGNGDDRDAKVGTVSISAAWQDSGSSPSVDNDARNGMNGVVVKFPRIKVDGSAPTAISENQLVAAHRYDSETHQLQVRVMGVTYATETDPVSGKETKWLSAVTPVSEWIMVEGGQAVEHNPAEDGSGQAS